MIFYDRTQAATLIAQKLIHYRNKNPLILGIPRGAMPMASMIAKKLGGEFDVVLVHKIGAPENPEFAIGSVSEFGQTLLSNSLAESAEFYGVSPESIKKSAQNEIAKLKQRRQSYSPIRPPIDPKDRIVIIVDDGIATGSTMLAAIRAVRSQNPRKIVVAAPVASPRTLELLKAEVNELVILETPEDFFSISQFYENFPQVSDDEVFEILSSEKAKEVHRTRVPVHKKAG